MGRNPKILAIGIQRRLHDEFAFCQTQAVGNRIQASVWAANLLEMAMVPGAPR